MKKIFITTTYKRNVLSNQRIITWLYSLLSLTQQTQRAYRISMMLLSFQIVQRILVSSKSWEMLYFFKSLSGKVPSLYIFASNLYFRGDNLTASNPGSSLLSCLRWKEVHLRDMGVFKR